MYRRRRRRLKFKIPWPKQVNLGKVVFFGLLAATLFVIGLFAYYSQGLPDPGDVNRQSGFSTQILDRTGKVVLYDVYQDQNRQYASFSDIPQYLKDATVAIEDREFYKHQGFDPMAIPRIIKNVIVSHRLIGGSTLTQQLVKNVLLTNERTISRKIKEFILALRIERRYTKDEILQMYLNEAPYGGAAVGVSAAAEQYFGKDVKDLTLAESIVLAGLPQSPTYYSPYGSNPKAYVPRAEEVSKALVETGKITKQQEAEVNKQIENMKFTGTKSKINAPHFVMYVKKQLEDMYGSSVMESGGFKVYTTLDWGLQQKAQDIVTQEIDKVSDRLHISNGASVIMDTNTGEILSMVGSKDFFDATIDGEVNVVTRQRQPGSSIKPLVYATAFMKGYSPASVLADVVTKFPGATPDKPYEPKNYDGKEHGLLHLRNALGSSINIPAVKLIALVGVKDVLAQGYKMGFTTLAPTQANLSRLGLSMALGGGEVTLLDESTAYSAFSNGGYKIQPVSILKIEDRNGKVIYQNKQISKERVLDAKVAFLINNILSDNNARLITFSPNSYLNMGQHAVAVKTGTTNDLRDNWTVGWTNGTIVGVWVGNDDNSKMKNVASGVSGAAPIWRREMLDVLSVRPDKPFDIPKGVSQIEVDKISGYPAHDNFPSYKEWFIDGTVPSGPDPIHAYLKVCKGDPSKLADPVSVSQGNYDQKEFVVIKEKDPLTGDDMWQKAINDWINRQSDPLYKFPTEYCSPTADMDIKIVSPSDHQRIDGDTVTIRATVASTSPVSRVDIYVDDTLEKSFDSQPYVLDLSHLSQGNHKIRVHARNSDGKERDTSIEFAMNADWASPTPTSTPTPTP